MSKTLLNIDFFLSFLFVSCFDQCDDIVVLGHQFLECHRFRNLLQIKHTKMTYFTQIIIFHHKIVKEKFFKRIILVGKTACKLFFFFFFVFSLFLFCLLLVFFFLLLFVGLVCSFARLFVRKFVFVYLFVCLLINSSFWKMQRS